MIVATAGHVDHGKTSLVRALTGVDTDRLPEERRRGMTIDLGFAYAGPLGFVDVPGHERFVHNMLAGVGGIDCALLVVAADDGVMPQTREHLAILDLLGIARGAVAVTKVDRVAAERVAEVRDEVAALLAATALGGAPLFALSSTTGEGIDALRRHLEQVAQSIGERNAAGNFRLGVDRCFTIAGAGLVVTGTALSGEVKIGDEVHALLAGSSARVRSIHAHNKPAERGRAGQRLALNLANVKNPIARGEWIVAGNVPPAVMRFDARLRSIGEPIKHWTPVHVHLGATDVLGRVALLDEAGLVQMVLEQPVGAVQGDRFIVRDQSARRTLGGGVVIDVFPPPKGRAKPERLACLRAMEAEDLDALLEASPLGVDLARYSANRNLPAMSGWRFAPVHWQTLKQGALERIAAWHRDFPQSGAMPQDRIAKAAREVQAMLVEALVREGAVVREGAGLRLAGHRVELAPADAKLWSRLRPLLEQGALRPPSVAELAAALTEDARRLEAALARLAAQGLVVRVSKTRFYLPAMVRRLEEIAAEEAGASGAITAAGFRDRSQIGRNLAIEVLEYFDRIKFTRRAGDKHVLVRGIQGRDSHPGGAPGLQIQ
ncbi:MAG TPA: selenocysteine-specific translation elongation factor [Burkholderiales bacterium]|nr:selenocysteine-specific translation elongation factor [Burkholderiales bacterium]